MELLTLHFKASLVIKILHQSHKSREIVWKQGGRLLGLSVAYSPSKMHSQLPCHFIFAAGVEEADD